jgi:hypothetical protein
MKVTGPASELDKLKKKTIGEFHLGHQNFKLDKIYTESVESIDDTDELTAHEVFDKLIEASDESASKQKSLKKLWRKLCA